MHSTIRELLELARQVVGSLDELVSEQRATRRAVEAQCERWIPWSETIRRIGGNAPDAEAALLEAIRDGRIRTYTVLKTGKRRVWSADLAHLVASSTAAAPTRVRQRQRLQNRRG